MTMVGSSSKEEAVKALYAVSALIRNNEIGQKMFYAEEGNIMLQVDNGVQDLQSSSIHTKDLSYVFLGHNE